MLQKHVHTTSNYPSGLKMVYFRLACSQKAGKHLYLLYILQLLSTDVYLCWVLGAGCVHCPLECLDFLLRKPRQVVGQCQQIMWIRLLSIQDICFSQWKKKAEKWVCLRRSSLLRVSPKCIPLFWILGILNMDVMF